MNKFKKLFRNKKILITGFNGFKGTWLSLCLYLLGAKLYGVSLKSKQKNNHFNLLKRKIFINKVEQYVWYDENDGKIQGGPR